MADLHFNRGIDRAADEVFHAVEQRADVDRSDPEVLPPRESQQPLHEGSGAARRLEAGVDQPLRTVVGRQAPAQEVEVSNYRRQQIVEVVCDTAGQLPERLQLLSFVELGEGKLMV